MCYFTHLLEHLGSAAVHLHEVHASLIKEFYASFPYSEHLFPHTQEKSLNKIVT